MSELILVYDLPSENQKKLEDESAKIAVKNVRIASIRLLHRLGLPSTESVILVPANNREEAERAIEEVKQRYAELSERLGIDVGKPLIRLLQLEREQSETFRELAERRLLERIDEAIDRISDILEVIDEITEEAKIKKLKNNIRRLRREFNTIANLARTLGIDVRRDMDYLMNLIDQAYEELRRRD